MSSPLYAPEGRARAAQLPPPPAGLAAQPHVAGAQPGVGPALQPGQLVQPAGTGVPLPMAAGMPPNGQDATVAPRRGFAALKSAFDKVRGRVDPRQHAAALHEEFLTAIGAGATASEVHDLCLRAIEAHHVQMNAPGLNPAGERDLLKTCAGMLLLTCKAVAEEAERAADEVVTARTSVLKGLASLHGHAHILKVLSAHPVHDLCADNGMTLLADAISQGAEACARGCRKLYARMTERSADWEYDDLRKGSVRATDVMKVLAECEGLAPQLAAGFKDEAGFFTARVDLLMLEAANGWADIKARDMKSMASGECVDRLLQKAKAARALAQALPAERGRLLRECSALCGKACDALGHTKLSWKDLNASLGRIVEIVASLQDWPGIDDVERAAVIESWSGCFGAHRRLLGHFVVESEGSLREKLQKFEWRPRDAFDYFNERIDAVTSTLHQHILGVAALASHPALGAGERITLLREAIRMNQTVSVSLIAGAGRDLSWLKVFFDAAAENFATLRRAADALPQVVPQIEDARELMHRGIANTMLDVLAHEDFDDSLDLLLGFLARTAMPEQHFRNLELCLAIEQRKYQGMQGAARRRVEAGGSSSGALEWEIRGSKHADRSVSTVHRELYFALFRLATGLRVTLGKNAAEPVIFDRAGKVPVQQVNLPALAHAYTHYEQHAKRERAYQVRIGSFYNTDPLRALVSAKLSDQELATLARHEPDIFHVAVQERKLVQHLPPGTLGAYDQEKARRGVVAEIAGFLGDGR